jgi:hypothetical protein
MAILFNGVVPGTSRSYDIPVTITDKFVTITTTPLNIVGLGQITSSLQPLLLIGGEWLPVLNEYRRIATKGIFISPYTSYRLRIVQNSAIAGYNLVLDSIAPSVLNNVAPVPCCEDSFVQNAVTVAANVASIVLLASNPLRLGGALISNTSNRDLWIQLGSAVAGFAFPAIEIERNGGIYELPAGYTGQVQGRWDGGNPSQGANILEYLKQ